MYAIIHLLLRSAKRRIVFKFTDAIALAPAHRHPVPATGSQDSPTGESSAAGSIERKAGHLTSQKSCDLVENWLCYGEQTAWARGKLSSTLHDNTHS
jgi:hypothetical protein